MIESQVIKLSSFYKISGLVLKIEHHNDSLFDSVDADLWPFACDEVPTVNGQIKFRLGSNDYSAPSESVLCGHWKNEGLYSYTRGKMNCHIHSGSARIVRDLENCCLQVDYCEVDDWLKKYVRIAIKWLTIKLAEENGHAYIHASGAFYRHANVVFAGDSGSGKTSCLHRLVANGGMVFSDDSLLIVNNRITPFVLRPSIRGDFADRFALRTAASRDEIQIRETLHCLPTGIQLLIFPKIWNYHRSEHKELSPSEAIDRLIHSYLKETRWNAYPSNIDTVREMYEKALVSAKIFSFHASNHEKEVVTSLMNLIDNAIGR